MKQNRGLKQMAGNTDKAASALGGEAPVEKKKRKTFTRKPTELAVVVRVTDESGDPITGANVEILTASKDISAAFRKFKETEGADMVTFTLGEKKEADVSKAA